MNGFNMSNQNQIQKNIWTIIDMIERVLGDKLKVILSSMKYSFKTVREMESLKFFVNIKIVSN